MVISPLGSFTHGIVVRYGRAALLQYMKLYST